MVSEAGGGMSDSGGMGAMGDGGGGGTGVGNETLVCRKSSASGTEGVKCNAADVTSCAAGLTCAQPPDGNADAVCYKFCGADSECTAPGGWCHPGPLETSASEGFTAKTCSLNCDPIAQTGCGTGQSCNLAISTDRSRLYTQCIGAGAGGYLAACTVPEDCKAPFSCLKVSVNGGAETQVCLQPCIAGADPDGGAADAGLSGACPASEVCRAIAPPNTLGSTQYGWCY